MPTLALVNLQLSDPKVRIVYDMVKGGNPKSTSSALSKHSDEVKTLCSIYESLLVANNGTLYRKKPSTENQQPFTQIIVPFSERRRIAEELHQGLNGGHMGIRRTLWQVKRRFYWPGWSKDIRRVVNHCEKCVHLCNRTYRLRDIIFVKNYLQKLGQGHGDRFS